MSPPQYFRLVIDASRQASASGILWRLAYCSLSWACSSVSTSCGNYRFYWLYLCLSTCSRHHHLTHVIPYLAVLGRLAQTSSSNSESQELQPWSQFWSIYPWSYHSQRWFQILLLLGAPIYHSDFFLQVVCSVNCKVLKDVHSRLSSWLAFASYARCAKDPHSNPYLSLFPGN